MTGPGHLGDALSAMLDGELVPSQEATARAHVVACMDCAAELNAVRQARAWVRALPLVDPPFGFYDRILLDGRRAPVPIGTLRRRAGLAVLGAAAVTVTVLGVGSPTTPTTPIVDTGPRLVEARSNSAGVGADLLSKLAPMAVPVSFGR